MIHKLKTLRSNYLQSHELQLPELDLVSDDGQVGVVLEAEGVVPLRLGVGVVVTHGQVFGMDRYCGRVIGFFVGVGTHQGVGQGRIRLQGYC